MVITCWKGNKMLQAISIKLEHGKRIVIWCLDQDVIKVTCSKDILLYLTKGGQHCVTGASFQLIPLQKCCNKALFGIADFSLLSSLVV
eukprot:13635999-Ditylum_brightwellii.AAC.1